MGSGIEQSVIIFCFLSQIIAFSNDVLRSEP